MKWTPVANLAKVAPRPGWQLEFRQVAAFGRFGIVLVRYRRAGR